MVASWALDHQLADLDNSTAECFQQITGIALSAAAREQLFLRLGGVGLKASSDLALTAFATTVGRFRAEGAPLVGCPEMLCELGTTEFQHVLGLLKQQAPPAVLHAVCWLADHVCHPPPPSHDDFLSLRWWGDTFSRWAHDCCWLGAAPPATEALGLRLNREEVIVLLNWWPGVGPRPAVAVDTEAGSRAHAAAQGRTAQAFPGHRTHTHSGAGGGK